MVTIAVVIAILCGRGLQAESPNLICQPGQNTPACRWSPVDGKALDGPKDGVSPVYKIAGSPYGMTGAIEGLTIMKPPANRKLRFSLLLRGTRASQTYAIVAVGINVQAKTALPWTAEWEWKGELPVDKWTSIERDIVVPTGTSYLRMILHNPNKEPILMSAPSLVVGEPQDPDADAIALAQKDIALAVAEREHPSPSAAQAAADRLARQQGPVVAHILIRAPLCTKRSGERAIATFPAPAFCKGQVPLAFKMTCQLPGKLIGYGWRKRTDNRNLICEVTLQPGKKGSWVQYEALVLLGGPDVRDNAGPVSGWEWRQSTACVQSSAPAIRAIERKLTTSNDSTESYARKVFKYVRDDHGKGAPFKALDALAALECGGSCTNKANLAAALLRAHGIPARTVSHMPTWCSEKLYEHWLTEYWQADVGWVALDPALGRWDPDRRTRVVLSVANPSDENLAFNPLHERFVMPGAPYLSVVELTPALYPADLTDDDAINSVDQVALIRVNERQEAALFAVADHSFRALYPKLARGTAGGDRYERVLAAVKAGSATALTAALSH